MGTSEQETPVATSKDAVMNTRDRADVDSSIRSLLTTRSDYLNAEITDEKNRWYEESGLKYKNTVPNRIELLLNGLYSFSNPSNHPSAGRNLIDKKSDFYIQMTALASISERISELSEELLQTLDMDSEESMYRMFSQNVTIPDLSEVYRPKPSIHLYRLSGFLHDMSSFLNAASETGVVSLKSFMHAGKVLRREIDQSIFFNPPPIIIRSYQILPRMPLSIIDLLSSLEGDPACVPMNVCITTFIQLKNLILDLLSTNTSDEEKVYEAVAILALVRHLSRSLWIYMIRDAPRTMADTFSDIVREIDANKITLRYPILIKNSRNLLNLRNIFTSLGFQLRLETRRAYDLEIPPMPDLIQSDDFTGMLNDDLESLAAFYDEAALLLIERIPGSEKVIKEIFSAEESVTRRRERHRRDAWMFTQVTKGFIAKLSTSKTTADSWSETGSMEFAREFAGYFRSMAYPILIRFKYDREEDMLEVLARLREGDTLYKDKSARVQRECNYFKEFLVDTKKNIDKNELKDIPFDRKSAGRVLKFYLGYD